MLNSRINIFCWRKNRERKRTTCHIQPSHQCSFIYWTKKERKRTPSHAELSHQCYLNTEQRKREKSSCHIQLSHKCSFIYWTRERRKKNFMSSCALASLLFRFPGYLTWGLSLPGRNSNIWLIKICFRFPIPSSSAVLILTSEIQQNQMPVLLFWIKLRFHYKSKIWSKSHCLARFNQQFVVENEISALGGCLVSDSPQPILAKSNNCY